MLDLSYHSYTEEKFDDILHFCAAHPWKPLWPKDYIFKFINHLISSNALVFDLFSHDERIAVAVLIDKIQNKGKDACLEILGLNSHYSVTQIYKSLVTQAKNKLPHSLSGIEITVSESHHEIINFLKQENFSLFYDLYEMQCEPKQLPFSADNIIELNEEDFAQCYQVIHSSFEDNPEIAIPHYEDWLASRKTESNQIWVYKENNQLLGFVNLIFDTTKQFGDISSIGVLPQQRKKGIGKKLLQFSLGYFKQLNLRTCHLTVTAKNTKALSLYRELGFEVCDHFKVLRCKA